MKMMKFSELVQCWGPPETSHRSEEEAAEAAVSSTSSGERRRRGESSGKGLSPSSSSRRAVVWRPSLGAIYEDKAAAAATTGGVKTVEVCGRSKERAEKSRREVAPAKSRSQKLRARDDRDRYGQVGVATVIPAFTPTAFLF
ncbi:hypothetical protein H6P81_007188 [Aristolochia fimbriata]|uniref:Uncharacterized protein n=1 Tax=Aristolochia fimbriata TaxID=158543 RepID=A0AAV7F0S1_ARIFI|nr:hypothetical protein H6P81_007188 [Aristolochia fimbriata]